jgi:SsrA-binding protein
MRITNRRAFHDFQILEKVEAGIHLTGPEVKSIKGGHATIDGAFVKIIGSEAYLVNAQVFPYEHARLENYDPQRTRKLLLHKKEILALKGRVQQANLTLIPLACYNKAGLVKLEIALAKGKKQFEKREAIKRRDLERAAAEELRGKD